MSLLTDLGLTARNENPVYSGDRALRCNLILTAVLDALEQQAIRINATPYYQARYKKQLCKNALIWLGLEEGENDPHLTFNECCESIDRDPETVRKAIKEFIEKNKKVSYYPTPRICERFVRES